MTTLSQLVPSIAMALGPQVEVVLHDLSLLPNSIVAVGGNLTNRSAGGPMTDLMLRRIRRNRTDDLLGYRVVHLDRTFQASTIFLRHPNGKPYGCLCINIDVTSLLRIGALTRDLLGLSGHDERDQFLPAEEPPVAWQSNEPQAVVDSGEDDASDHEETYPQTVNELAESVVDRSVSRIGIPVSLMRKEHKLEVVKAADMSGLFLMRAAVDSIARRLQVSRYTIYNYLAEIRCEVTDVTNTD
jgi:predicted transcriptional regulator YheO